MFTAAVLALRAYTTAAFASLNRPLRDLDRTDPHGFPATVSLIKEAIGKLRTVGAEGDDANRTVDFFRGMRNVQNSESFLQDGVTELGVARSSVRCGLSVFICSLGSRGSEQVLPRGEEGKLEPWCSDRCVCRLGHSDDVNNQRFGVAVRYANSRCSLIFKLRTESFIERGASLSYLSAFPARKSLCTVSCALPTQPPTFPSKPAPRSPSPKAFST